MCAWPCSHLSCLANLFGVLFGFQAYINWPISDHLYIKQAYLFELFIYTLSDIRLGIQKCNSKHK